MQQPDKAERLARAYPLLRDIPVEERVVIARKAFRSPLVLGCFLVFVFLVLPLYCLAAFNFFGIEHTQNFKVMKIGFIAVLPAFAGVLLFRGILMPRAITKILAARHHNGV